MNCWEIPGARKMLTWTREASIAWASAGASAVKKRLCKDFSTRRNSSRLFPAAPQGAASAGGVFGSSADSRLTSTATAGAALGARPCSCFSPIHPPGSGGPLPVRQTGVTSGWRVLPIKRSQNLISHLVEFPDHLQVTCADGVDPMETDS